mmetsp:Transcript_11870/g.37727  ORF Transcript_11870/g.37727 Transcript_11870/m.37727 type:complete len:265 (+) Transcript_11870:101-895(+)
MSTKHSSSCCYCNKIISPVSTVKAHEKKCLSEFVGVKHCPPSTTTAYLPPSYHPHHPHAVPPSTSSQIPSDDISSAESLRRILVNTCRALRSLGGQTDRLLERQRVRARLREEERDAHRVNAQRIVATGRYSTHDSRVRQREQERQPAGTVRVGPDGEQLAVVRPSAVRLPQRLTRTRPMAGAVATRVRGFYQRTAATPDDATPVDPALSDSASLALLNIAAASHAQLPLRWFPILGWERERDRETLMTLVGGGDMNELNQHRQ